MRKIVIITLILVLMNSIVYSFDYKAYTPSNFDKITLAINEVKKELTEKKREKGFTVFRSKYKIPFKLRKYPVEMDKEYIGIIDVYERILLGSGDRLSKLFGYQIEYEYNGIEFVLLFQTVLIDYLRKEITLNETIHLYVLWGTYDDYSNKAILLVNEFQKVPQQNK